MKDSAYQCSGYIFTERERKFGVPVALREISCSLHLTVHKEMEGASFERGYVFYLIFSRSSTLFIAPAIDLRIISRREHPNNFNCVFNFSTCNILISRS